MPKKGKGNWPYRVQLAGPFVKANSEETSRWLAIEPLPLTHAFRGPEGDLVLYGFASEGDAAMFH